MMNVSIMRGISASIKIPPKSEFLEPVNNATVVISLRTKCLTTYLSGITKPRDITIKINASVSYVVKILVALNDIGLIKYESKTGLNRVELKIQNIAKCLLLIKEGVNEVDKLTSIMSVTRTSIYTYLHELNVKGLISYVKGNKWSNSEITYIGSC